MKEYTIVLEVTGGDIYEYSFEAENVQQAISAAVADLRAELGRPPKLNDIKVK